MPSQLERIADLEANQKNHEQSIRQGQSAHVDLESRFGELHLQVQLMAVTVDGIDPRLESMDKSLKILADDKRDRDTLASDKRGRKLDAKDWLIIAIACLGLLTGLPAALQALKALGWG
jgi:hypothetical protein